MDGGSAAYRNNLKLLSAERRSYLFPVKALIQPTELKRRGAPLWLSVPQQRRRPRLFITQVKPATILAEALLPLHL